MSPVIKSLLWLFALNMQKCLFLSNHLVWDKAFSMTIVNKGILTVGVILVIKKHNLSNLWFKFASLVWSRFQAFSRLYFQGIFKAKLRHCKWAVSLETQIPDVMVSIM